MKADSRSNGHKKRAKGFVIAMDGPAGVGKSTVGKFVAAKLGYNFINTGEMYRALTWKALEQGLEPSDERRVVGLARRLKWEFKPAEAHVLSTFIDGTRVDKQIRTEEVSRSSSVVAGIPGVRRLMRTMQRRIGRKGGVVMEGRDITTNVFPDAEFKFYLDASISERARRRYGQLKRQGLPAKLEDIRNAIRARDLYDSRRKINPLTQAADALVIDSTHMSLRQVAGRILREVRGAA